LRQRLEELNWRTLKTEEVVEIPDSKVTRDERDGETKLSA
jgi:hypothetical protein